MSDGYEYVIEMVDRISGPAKTARQQIEALTGELAAEEKELRKLETAYENLQKAEQVDIALARKMQAAIEAKKGSIASLGDKLRGSVTKQRELAQAELDVANEAKSAQDGIKGLSSALSAAGPYVMAAVAALALLGGALAAALVAGASLSVEAAKFKKDTTAALKSALGTEAAAASTFREIRKISDEIGITEAKAQKLGLSLLDAGVARNDLGDAIKSIALLEKVRGEQAAGKIEELIKKSAAAGSFKFDEGALEGSGLKKADVLGELAKRLKKDTATIEAELKAGTIKAADGIAAVNSALATKLGGSAGLMGLEDAVGKFKEKISRLFEDVDTGPFFELVSDIAALFDEASISGTALKFLATEIFSGLFRVARAVFPYIKVAILELVIIALKLYIAAKPIVATIKELFGVASEGDALAKMVRTIVGLLAGVAITVTFLVGLFLAWNAAIAFGFGYLLTKLAEADAAIRNGLGAAFQWLKSLLSTEAGGGIAAALIDGLVAGLTGGGSRVIQALVAVGRGAIAGVKGVLGIASPSKVMQEMGGYTAEGFAMGVEDGTADTRGALEAAVSPSTLAPAAPAASSGGGAQVVFAEGSIVIHAGGASAGELVEMLAAHLADKLEEILMQGGGAMPAGGAS